MSCDGSWGSFWVLDGHGGDGAAYYCAPALNQVVGARLDDLPPDSSIEASFASVDGDFRRYVGSNPDKDSGSTVIGMLASRQTDGTYTVKLVNCGDSRSILIWGPSEDEAAAAKPLSVALPAHVAAARAADGDDKVPWPLIAETVDHKPDHPTERARIQAAGGYISRENPSHPARLDGNLAVSRGMGDFEYKSDGGRSVPDQKVSCVPDIYSISGVQSGSICVIACDGLWDVLTGEQVAGIVRDELRSKPAVDLGELAAKLVRESLEMNSRDNVTVMIVHFVDGAEFAKSPSGTKCRDEMMHFEKLRNGDALDDDVRQQYMKFLKSCNFPSEPQVCETTGRWFLHTKSEQ